MDAFHTSFGNISEIIDERVRKHDDAVSHLARESHQSLRMRASLAVLNCGSLHLHLFSSFSLSVCLFLSSFLCVRSLCHFERLHAPSLFLFVLNSCASPQEKRSFSTLLLIDQDLSGRISVISICEVGIISASLLHSSMIASVQHDCFSAHIPTSSCRSTMVSLICILPHRLLTACVFVFFYSYFCFRSLQLSSRFLYISSTRQI